MHTETGLSTAGILDGMDQAATLLTIDNDATVVGVARRHLGHGPRVTFHFGDGAAFLATLQSREFDYIFADTWPGKYDHLDEALRLLNPGGFYLIDDMLPQPNWPAGHAAKVQELTATLEQREELILTQLHWSSGLIVATRKA